MKQSACLSGLLLLLACLLQCSGTTSERLHSSDNYPQLSLDNVYSKTQKRGQLSEKAQQPGRGQLLDKSQQRQKNLLKNREVPLSRPNSKLNSPVSKNRSSERKSKNVKPQRHVTKDHPWVPEGFEKVNPTSPLTPLANEDIFLRATSRRYPNERTIIPVNTSTTALINSSTDYEPELTYDEDTSLEDSFCHRLVKTGLLNNDQARLCLEDALSIVAALSGKRLGLLECTYQFQFERWNCSVGSQLAAVAELPDIGSTTSSDEMRETTTPVSMIKQNNDVSYQGSSHKKGEVMFRAGGKPKIKKDLRKARPKTSSGIQWYSIYKQKPKRQWQTRDTKSRFEKANYDLDYQDEMMMMMDDPNAVSPDADGITEKRASRNKRKASRREADEESFNPMVKNRRLTGKPPQSGTEGQLADSGKATKETAFIQAITSAGVAQAVTEACSAGNLTDCSCLAGPGGAAIGEGPRKPRNLETLPKSEDDAWKWGGCSDNVEYGLQFAAEFTDGPERLKQEEALRHGQNRDLKALVNLHNNEVGRKVLYSMMRMKCRCHGVSGSCGVRTCWRALPNFRDVGDALKKKYESSVEISPKIPSPEISSSNFGMEVSSSSRRVLNSSGENLLLRREKRRRSEPISDTELVYVEKSPNYCKRDLSRGIAGTKGRVCDRDSDGPEGCRSLCCGRGYKVEVVKNVERCNCKFIWCCSVQCKTCEKVEKRYTCK